jgi:hypothetical protein
VLSRTVAIALIAFGAVLAVLGVLQHEGIVYLRVDHLAIILLGLGVIAVVAGVLGMIMQGRGSTPLA